MAITEDRIALAERVLAATDAFILACPAVTARRCFMGFPEAIDAAYAELWSANISYVQSAPLDEQYAAHGLTPPETATD